jgi:hypothetical protein
MQTSTNLYRRWDCSPNDVYKRNWKNQNGITKRPLTEVQGPIYWKIPRGGGGCEKRKRKGGKFKRKRKKGERKWKKGEEKEKRDLKGETNSKTG